MIRAIDTTNDKALLRLLNQDPAWSVYAICDLDPTNRAHARYLVDDENDPHATVLIYIADTFTTIIPCGGRAALRSLISRAGLPETAAFQAREPDLVDLAIRFRISERIEMLRMLVRSNDMRLDVPAPLPVRRLLPPDLPGLIDLYAAWPDSVFSPRMLAMGVYYGAFDGDRLVAAAGTHAVSLSAHMGIIGCVFTQPAYRGRGLARAATAAVMQTLGAAGVETIALNVSAANVAAVSAYSALGFCTHQQFYEGTISAL